MGRKNKLKRFADVATFPNVYEVDPAQESFLSNQEGSSSDLRGHWASGHFHNDHPVILELACGKGDYTVALAKDHPENNYIGVDIKGARMWKGARTCAGRPGWVMWLFYAPGSNLLTDSLHRREVSAIWITFPDPFEGKITRRLMAAPFLERYRRILKPGGIIHLKTDSPLIV